MMNNKQTAVFNSMGTAGDYNVSGTSAVKRGITALYSRLSQEDNLVGESLSITHQREILEKYAIDQGFSNIVHFCDDDISGSRFDRDAWQELIAEVEAGNVVNCILKDMSRWGRDHVQVGLYMEIFRKKGVRFIAISNGIDSMYPETLEFAPFINIMNEWYARDTSRKIKTVAHARGNAGKPLSYNTIYGYRKSPGDKNVWLIDEEPANIVRRIFQMTLDGMGAHQIARQLTSEKIEKPSVYFTKNKMVGDRPSRRDLSNPYDWHGATVKQMLKKPEYCGHRVNFRTYKESYKDKHSKWNPKDKWKIFHNNHDAIIDQDVFDTVQRLIGTPRRIDKIGEANPFTGLIFCADCGAKLYNSRQSKEYYIEKRFGKEYKHKTQDFYSCSTYKLNQKYLRQKCTNHFIRTVVLQELVLDTIKRVSGYVRDNEADFVEKIRKTSEVKQAETAKAHLKTITKNQHRINELDLLFQKVYEDNATGKLSDERFGQLSNGYEREQAELKHVTAQMQANLTAYEKDSLKAGSFIEVVKRYTEFDTLTNAMLNEFVEKIVVYEADKTGLEREQQVDIHLNFIGHFEVPTEEPPPPTEAELIEQELLRRKREYQREANKRYYEQRKRKHEFLRALEAGEISDEELEAHTQAQLAKEEADKALREQRRIERSNYAKEWARKSRDKKRAERDAQKANEPQLTPEEKIQIRKDKQREYARNWYLRKKEKVLAGKFEAETLATVQS